MNSMLTLVAPNSPLYTACRHDGALRWVVQDAEGKLVTVLPFLSAAEHKATAVGGVVREVVNTAFGFALAPVFFGPYAVGRAGVVAR